MAMIGTDVGAGTPVSTSHGSGKVTAHGASGSRAGHRSAPGAFDALMSSLSDSESQDSSSEPGGISERGAGRDSAHKGGSAASRSGDHSSSGHPALSHGRHAGTERTGRVTVNSQNRSVADSESQAEAGEAGNRSVTHHVVRADRQEQLESSSANSDEISGATDALNAAFPRPYLSDIAVAVTADEATSNEQGVDINGNGVFGSGDAATDATSVLGQTVATNQAQLTVVPTVVTFSNGDVTLSDGAGEADSASVANDSSAAGSGPSLPQALTAEAESVVEPQWLSQTSARNGVQPRATSSQGSETGKARTAVLLELRRALAAMDRAQSDSAADASPAPATFTDVNSPEGNVISDNAASATARSSRVEQNARTRASEAAERIIGGATTEGNGTTTRGGASDVADRNLTLSSNDANQATQAEQNLSAFPGFEDRESRERLAPEETGADHSRGTSRGLQTPGDTVAGDVQKSTGRAGYSQFELLANAKAAATAQSESGFPLRNGSLQAESLDDVAPSGQWGSLSAGLPTTGSMALGAAAQSAVGSSSQPSNAWPTTAGLAGTPGAEQGDKAQAAQGTTAVSTPIVNTLPSVEQDQQRASTATDVDAALAGQSTATQTASAQSRTPFDSMKSQVGRHAASSRASHRQTAQGSDLRGPGAALSERTSTQLAVDAPEKLSADEFSSAAPGSDDRATATGAAAHAARESAKSGDANRVIEFEDASFASASTASESGAMSPRSTRADTATFVSTERTPRLSAHNARAIAAFQAASLASAATFASSREVTALPRASFDAALDTHVTGQLVHAVRVQAEQGGGQARITLNPTFLGDVAIDVRTNGNSVVASVHASNADVREWMRTNENALRQSLADQGLALAQFVIADDESENGQSSGERDTRQHDDRQEQWQRRNRQTPEHSTFEVVL